MERSEENRKRTQQDVVGSLNLLTNMIVVWNTIYQQQVIEQLRGLGHDLLAQDVSHLSSARFEHINQLGKYTFLASPDLQNKNLHLLRACLNFGGVVKKKASQCISIS